MTRQDDAELEPAALLEDGVASPEGDAGHHVGEDQDGHSLADAALGDELTQPHHECRSRGEGQADEPGPPEGEVGDEVDVSGGAEQPAAAVVEHVDQARRLQQGQAMVRYRVVWVSFFCPTAPWSRHCSSLGITVASSWMMMLEVM